MVHADIKWVLHRSPWVRIAGKWKNVSVVGTDTEICLLHAPLEVRGFHVCIITVSEFCLMKSISQYPQTRLNNPYNNNLNTIKVFHADEWKQKLLINGTKNRFRFTEVSCSFFNLFLYCFKFIFQELQWKQFLGYILREIRTFLTAWAI